MTSDSPTPGTQDPRSASSEIVVGFDGSASATDAFARGVALATALHTRLRLITTWVYPLSYGGLPLSDWSPEGDAYRILDDAVATAFPAGRPAWLTVSALQGVTAQILIEQSRDAEMLVVGSRGHGGFAGLLLGSVSAACAEHAHCPVLVVHARPAATEAPAADEALAAVGS